MNRFPMIPALLAGLLLTAPAVAQGPGGGPWGPPPPRPPFAAGVVTSVDATAGDVTLSSRFGGDSQTITVPTGTQILTLSAATVSDLKVGDQVQVRGVPTGITASSLLDGQMPAFFPQGGGPGGPGGPGMPPPGMGGPGGPASPAMAMAHGKVVSLNPLTISVSDGVSVVLKLAPSAKISLIKSISLTGIKAGDRIMAMGQTGTDGTLTARMVGVNLPMGGPGPGFGPGPGGFRRGGPGFGGRGGFGPGPGGPGPGGPGAPGFGG